MLNRRGFISCAICSAMGYAATEAAAQGSPQGAAPAAPSGITRTVIGKAELPGERYVVILMEAEFDPALKVARHTHPGVESSYLIAGGGVLSVKGQADRTLKAGDAFQIPAELPHAFEVGAQKTRLVITYAVDKDRPIASPAPE